MHYVYPYPHVDDVMPLMAEGSVLPYLDIPFQHGSPSVLKRMRRPAHAENTLARIHAWRAGARTSRCAAPSSSAFPARPTRSSRSCWTGCEEAQLDRVGCFKYSPVDGATANALPDHVAPEVQDERYERFMSSPARSAPARLAQRVGKRMRVLVDAVTDGVAIARSEGDAPEIDGVVHIEGAGALRSATGRTWRSPPPMPTTSPQDELHAARRLRASCRISGSPAIAGRLRRR